MCDVCRKPTEKLNILQCMKHSVCTICFENISLRIKTSSLISGTTCPLCKPRQAPQPRKQEDDFDWLGVARSIAPPPGPHTIRDRKDDGDDLCGYNEDLDATLEAMINRKPQTHQVKHKPKPPNNGKSHRRLGKFLADATYDDDYDADAESETTKGDVTKMFDINFTGKPLSTTSSSDEWGFDLNDFSNLWHTNKKTPQKSKLPKEKEKFVPPGFGPGSHEQCTFRNSQGERAYLALEPENDNIGKSLDCEAFDSFFEIDPESGKELKYTLFNGKKICLSSSLKANTSISNLSGSEAAEYGSDLDRLSVNSKSDVSGSLATADNTNSPNKSTTEPEKDEPNSHKTYHDNKLLGDLKTMKDMKNIQKNKSVKMELERRALEADHRSLDSVDINNLDDGNKSEDDIQILETERGSSPVKPVDPNYKFGFTLPEPPKRTTKSKQDEESEEDNDEEKKNGNEKVEGPGFTSDSFAQIESYDDNDEFWDLWHH